MSHPSSRCHDDLHSDLRVAVPSAARFGVERWCHGDWCGLYSVRPICIQDSCQPKHPLHDLARDIGARGLGLAQDAMPGWERT